MCIFYFLNSKFFAFAIIEYKKFRRPGIFLREKVPWSALASAWEDFLLFWGGKEGGRGLMRRPAPTMLFLFAFVIRHSFVSFVIRNLYVNLLVIIGDTQSIRGIGSKEVNEKSAPTMLFYLHFVIRHALCQKLCKSVARSMTQSIRGMGSKEVMRSPAPTMPFLFAFCY